MLWLKNLPPYRRFQSTPPARGATTDIRNLHTNDSISIHAPREGGDNKDKLIGIDEFLFQSTPPARGATICKRAS